MYLHTEKDLYLIAWYLLPFKGQSGSRYAVNFGPFVAGTYPDP